MKASVKNVRISPKKLNVIAYIIRNMSAKEALDTLRFMPKKGADILYKVVASAVANATHNDSQNISDLVVNSVSVTQ
jgi:large subunit ribosomal protein L22